MIATIVEWFNDKAGDLNKSSDVILRMLLLLVEAAAIHLIFRKPILDCFFLSASIFFLVFDYWIAYTLIKNGTIEPPRGVKLHWFKYTGKAGFVDNIPLWKTIGHWGRFTVKAVVFLTALVIFIV